MVRCCGFFFFKKKTAYEMRISDWSSDVCSSDLALQLYAVLPKPWASAAFTALRAASSDALTPEMRATMSRAASAATVSISAMAASVAALMRASAAAIRIAMYASAAASRASEALDASAFVLARSEEHTSELQSLMRISYADFCLK